MIQNNEDIPVLIAYNGPLNGQKWPINHELIIGRDPKCDITIPERQVSRLHAKIYPENNSITIEDLGSKNGTYNNGEPVDAPTILLDGAIVQIALAQEFIFLTTEATLPLDFDKYSQKGKMLRLDPKSRRVWISDQELLPPLSAPQFKLLHLLYTNEDQVVSRQEIILHVWKEEVALGVSNQALDALARRLRERISSIDSTHDYIITVRGHGFRFENPIASISHPSK